MPTALTGAQVNVGIAAAIGTGTLTLGGTVLTSSSATGLLLPNPVTLSNSSVTLGGSNPLLFSGAFTLNGTNNTVFINSGVSVVIDGAIGGSAMLTKAGSGTLVLAGTNGYTGLTIVSGGIVQVQNSSAFGTAAGGTVVSNNASVQVLGAGLTVAEPLLVNGTGTDGTGAVRVLAGSSGTTTLSGGITLQSATTIGADAGTTIAQTTAAVAGVSDLTKLGQGTLQLNFANTYTGNTFVGTTTATGGILSVGNANGLGLAASVGGATGNITVNTTSTIGSTLQLSASVSGRNVTLNGTGFGNTVGGIAGALPQGAFSNLAGNNTWSGDITLVGTVGLTSGTIPLLSASNTGTLIGGLNNTTLTLTGNVGGGDLTKVGADTVVLLAPVTYGRCHNPRQHHGGAGWHPHALQHGG